MSLDFFLVLPLSHRLPSWALHKQAFETVMPVESRPTSGQASKNDLILCVKTASPF